MADDSTFMRLALEEAQAAYELGEIPIGAVIVSNGGEVIARAHNRREINGDATAHAEIMAIRAAGAKLKEWRLTGATIYVTLEPCPMCAGAMVMSRLKRLVYGCYDSKAGAAESLFNITASPLLNHQLEVTAGILEDECAGILRRFFAERRIKKETH